MGTVRQQMGTVRQQMQVFAIGFSLPDFNRIGIMNDAGPPPPYGAVTSSPAGPQAYGAVTSSPAGAPPDTTTQGAAGNTETYSTEAPPKYEFPKEGAYAQPQAGYQDATRYPPQYPTGYQSMPAVYQAPTVQQTVIVRQMTYGPDPQTMECPNCRAMITTSVNHSNGALTWIAAGLLCLFGCWLGCCLIPFCIPDMQDVEHRCPNCQSLLGVYGRI